MSGDVSDDHAAERLIETAHALGPKIVAMREQIEQERRLPSPLVEDLRQQGFCSQNRLHGNFSATSELQSLEISAPGE